MGWRADFRENLDAEGKSRNTVNAYCSDIDIYAEWFLQVRGKVFDPYSLVGPDVREYRRWCLSTGRVKASTWNRRRASLMAFAEWCQENEYIQGDPLYGVKEQQQADLPPYWLEPKEFRAFRGQLEENINRAHTSVMKLAAIRDRAIFALMMYAGLRVSEVVNLRRDNLLLRERSGRVFVRNGKHRTDAEVPLNYEARLALSHWLNSQKGEMVFDIGARQIQRRIKEIAIDARIENAADITPHWLRHSCARRLAIKDDGSINNPVGLVQMFMRHKRLETTTRYYQASWSDLERMADGL